jgi:enoyl-CoA hydratase/carnithine racemase
VLLLPGYQLTVSCLHTQATVSTWLG